MITPAASKYVSASKPPISTTVDHVHAESVPSEISVSMFAAPWRALASAARWKPSPLQKTTGVASANASHSQPEKCERGTIASRTSGTVSDDGDGEPAAERVVGVVVLLAGLVRVRAVAGGGDGAAQLVHGHALRVEGDARALGREVDGRVDAVELVQLALDARGARRARHPVEIELGALPLLGRGDGHARSAS